MPGTPNRLQGQTRCEAGTQSRRSLTRETARPPVDTKDGVDHEDITREACNELGRSRNRDLDCATLCAAGTAWGKEPATTEESRATCETPLIEQPFLAFEDDRDYVLAPGGSFEDPLLDGWTLVGGAGVDAVNEPFNLRGGADAMSLALRPGRRPRAR